MFHRHTVRFAVLGATGAALVLGVSTLASAAPTGHTTSPSMADSRVAPHALQRSSPSAQFGTSCWHSGQISTCRPETTARTHGTPRLSGSYVGRPHREHPGRSLGERIKSNCSGSAAKSARECG